MRNLHRKNTVALPIFWDKLSEYFFRPDFYHSEVTIYYQLSYFGRISNFGVKHECHYVSSITRYCIGTVRRPIRQVQSTRTYIGRNLVLRCRQEGRPIQAARAACHRLVLVPILRVNGQAIGLYLPTYCLRCLEDDVIFFVNVSVELKFARVNGAVTLERRVFFFFNIDKRRPRCFVENREDEQRTNTRRARSRQAQILRQVLGYLVGLRALKFYSYIQLLAGYDAEKTKVRQVPQSVRSPSLPDDFYRSSSPFAPL